MNNINSLILEGKIVGHSDFANGFMAIDLETRRKHKDISGKEIEEVNNFQCNVYGQMAKNITENYAIKLDGADVRIVGRIKQIKWTEQGEERSKVVVVAEHIEWKYTPKEKHNEEE